MKNTIRILYLLFALMLSTVTFAHAETFDLSGMSYDELIALHKQVSIAIMQSDEWKEVTVPVGEYVVGEDIPAGAYTLTAHNLTDIEVYSNGKCVHNHCLASSEQVGKLSLQDGQVVKIKYGSVVFSPYIGLGF